MMIVYRRIEWKEFWAFAKPILEQHYHEIAQFQDIPLSVDVPRYQQMEAAGALRLYTAWNGSHMVGYCAMVVQPNAHYSTSLQAGQDVLYLDPEFRRGRLGMRLIEFTEEELKSEGVQVIHQHSKISHPALGRLLDFLGYTRSDIFHSKRLY